MKYKFAKDNDGCWYLIPTELETEFSLLKVDQEDERWSKFNAKFENYSITEPIYYTFENPQHER